MILSVYILEVNKKGIKNRLLEWVYQSLTVSGCFYLEVEEFLGAPKIDRCCEKEGDIEVQVEKKNGESSTVPKIAFLFSGKVSFSFQRKELFKANKYETIECQ